MTRLTQILLEIANVHLWQQFESDELRTELTELYQLNERQKTIMANLADLTTAVNNYQSAVTAKLAADQSVIAADTQEITDLHNSPIPDELVASLNAATAALTPATDTTAPTETPVDGSTPPVDGSTP